MNKQTSEAAEKPVVVAAEFDLASLDTIEASNKGADIDIVHPVTKEPIGIFVTVLGKHSEAFRELVKERSNKRIKEDSLNARRGKFGKVRTAEDYENDAIEMLCACTVGWGTYIKDEDGNIVDKKPTILFEGEQLPWSVPNGMRVYTKMLWLRQQADDAIGDLENFIKA